MEGIGMFEQLFITMKELLDEISIRYDAASATEKIKLNDQLVMLKNMSDQFMEHWLEFEERLAAFYAQDHEVENVPVVADDDTEDKPQLPVRVDGGFEKAQGFYKLYMFDQAVKELEKLIQLQPDDLLARIYLAMGYLRLGEDGDAYPHFQMILPLTENNQLKAISYNAMGCIQVRKKNMQKAMEFFKLAYHSDPTCLLEPVGYPQQIASSQQRLP
jgi:tetratricopeptide (TPR) repeat protein